MYYLSIDFGTSAVKTSIVDDSLQVKSWSKAEYRYLILPGEKYELKEADLMTALVDAVRGLDDRLLSQVKVICYDTFSPSVVFMDRDGALVYPNIITHLDRRSRKQSDDIDRIIGKEAYRNISGIYPFAGGCSAMTLLWFLQNQPEVLEKSYYIGHLTTLIHKRFTGLWMVDFVNSSMLGLYETTTQGTWSEVLLKELQIERRLFPDIYYPGTMYGVLQKEMADLLGMKEGIPVCVGTNDVAAAQMGAGNNKAGQIMNTAGSSEMVSILTDKPITDAKYYLRNSALPGLWQIYATTCGGFGIQWFYEQFCNEMTLDEFYRYEDGEIQKYLTTGRNDVSFTPFLSGDRQSLAKKTASWMGLSLASTRGEMLVSLLVAIQDVIYGTIDKAARVQELDNVIKITGGMLTPMYLRLKTQLHPEYELTLVDDCPILGNVALAKFRQEGK
ncbi:sugar kinase [Lachnospiraceae bacterium MD1]|uniref:Sugar kinase n=1 Tax=Variimorphobacter saccharofermentans TaxID=2755051 RepID=A0A839K5N2_9FIRM|nr:FGGY family carbohydrate kinase [Variimorphobacter saccharofermentans]MBB2184369.1 sugar kinase [Variimorphobacter saccharofermentans]